MILFRADGNGTIGTGHIMRCLSIADGLKRIGEESVFVCADDNMKDFIESRGYRCEVLGTRFDDMESEIECFLCSEIYSESSVIVVDSYYVSDKYFECIRKEKKVVYIDDLIENAYSADALINYNIYASEDKYISLYSEKNIEKPVFILGTKYAPLREEFTNTKEKNTAEKPENILIMTGGADPTHIAPKLAERIVKEAETDTEEKPVFHFVAGAMSGDYDRLKEIETASKGRIVIHRNVKDMKSLMDSVDMAVSAAGSTLYELCACAVPTITYVLADNQMQAEKTFLEKGAMLSAGDARDGDVFFDRLYTTISELIKNSSERKHLSQKAFEIADGKGADRIAEILKELH